jgi:type II secretion system protein G
MKKTVSKKNVRGFTLIELLVVIAIIGILSTIVMVSLNTARSKARDVRRVSDVRQIQLALQMYFDVNSAYPTTLQGIAALVPTYLPVVPTDPQGGGNYSYCAPATLGYHLGATLENSGGVLGSDSDIAADGCTQGTFPGADPVFDVTP